MGRDAFVAAFGHVFEHSPWVAEATWDAGLPADADTAEGLHRAMCAALRPADRERKRALILAHPDLAGRLARAGRLTADSTREQASAGLDQLTDEERATFTALNAAYQARFGFPFIIAVKGRSKAEILAAFERRLHHDPQTEFGTALEQIERIALLRLKDLLP
jgi:OHCU decarboxylase